MKHSKLLRKCLYLRAMGANVNTLCLSSSTLVDFLFLHDKWNETWQTYYWLCLNIYLIFMLFGFKHCCFADNVFRLAEISNRSNTTYVMELLHGRNYRYMTLWIVFCRSKAKDGHHHRKLVT